MTGNGILSLGSEGLDAATAPEQEEGADERETDADGQSDDDAQVLVDGRSHLLNHRHRRRQRTQSGQRFRLIHHIDQSK